MIHQVKTKEIKTMTMVWKCGLSWHTFLRFYFFVYWTLVLVSIEKYIKYLRHFFITFSNTLNFVKNTLLHVVFSTIFSVFRNVNTVSCASLQQWSSFSTKDWLNHMLLESINLGSKVWSLFQGKLMFHALCINPLSEWYSYDLIALTKEQWWEQHLVQN